MIDLWVAETDRLKVLQTYIFKSLSFFQTPSTHCKNQHFILFPSWLQESQFPLDVKARLCDNLLEFAACGRRT